MTTIQAPQFIGEEEVATLSAQDQQITVADAYTGAVEELFYIDHPQLKGKNPEIERMFDEYKVEKQYEKIYIYYPWKKMIVATVPEDLYFKLRTARNRNIITPTEQQNYRNFSVAVAGLSVGSAIVSALVLTGGPKQLKIADFDTLEVTNLNRIHAKLTDIGKNKTLIASHEIWERDPFATVELWDKGVTKDTLKDFIANPKINVFIDEMDSLDLKIAARFICREQGVPVVMATDNGDGVLLDVERYDLDQTQPIMHGLLGEVTPDDFKDFDYRQWLQLATKIVGPTYLTERMQESLSVIGREIPSVPQLGTSANIAGAAIAFSIRRIANNLPLDSGRYVVSLEEKIIPGYLSEESIALRKQKTEAFIESFSKPR